MRKITFKEAASILLAVILLLTLPACSRSQGNNTENPAHTSTPTPSLDLLYAYELIYSYRNLACDAASFATLAGFLQSKDTLAVKDTDYTGEGILRIDFQLNLTEAEPNYQINFTKQMQDAAVLFALLDDIKGVEFNYEQADYSFGGVPIMREDAETLLGEDIAPFGLTEAAFTKEFPVKVQAVVWEPGVMDMVNYYHVMGFDE